MDSMQKLYSLDFFATFTLELNIDKSNGLAKPIHVINLLNPLNKI